MKGRRVLIASLAAAAVLAVAAAVYVASNPVDTTYEFVVRDAVSGNWVWDATFRLQGRVIRSHFQSDRGPRPQVFTRLQPGPAELEISAPSYVAQTIPVTLKRGANRLAEPVELVGSEIPDLAEWIVLRGLGGRRPGPGVASGQRGRTGGDQSPGHGPVDRRARLGAGAGGRAGARGNRHRRRPRRRAVPGQTAVAVGRGAGDYVSLRRVHPRCRDRGPAPPPTG